MTIAEQIYFNMVKKKTTTRKKVINKVEEPKEEIKESVISAKRKRFLRNKRKEIANQIKSKYK